MTPPAPTSGGLPTARQNTLEPRLAALTRTVEQIVAALHQHGIFLDPATTPLGWPAAGPSLRGPTSSSSREEPEESNSEQSVGGASTWTQLPQLESVVNLLAHSFAGTGQQKQYSPPQEQ